MKHLKICMYVIVMGVLVCTLTSCAATGSRLTASTAGDCGIKPGQKLMITAISDDDQTRKQFEDALCRELKKRKVAAAASHRIIPEASGLGHKTLLQKAGSKGMDYVLLAQAAGIKQTFAFSAYDPVLFYLGPGDTGGNWTAHQEQYIRQNATAWTHVKINTRLYDTKTGKRLWADTIDIARPAKNLSAQKVIDKAAGKIPGTLSAFCSSGS